VAHVTRLHKDPPECNKRLTSLSRPFWESRVTVKKLIQCCKILKAIVYTKLQVETFCKDNVCGYVSIVYCQITGKFPGLEI